MEQPTPNATSRMKSGRIFAPYLGAVLSDLNRSQHRVMLLALLAAIFLIVAATAYGQIQLNAWNQPFYDALARKDLADVFEQLKIFVGLASGLLILNVSQTWLNQMLKLRLRAALTNDLLNKWLAPKRAFLIRRAGEIGVNPDQRIQADAQHLADVSTDLGIGFVQSSLLLLSFVGVLWTLSEGVSFDLLGARIAIPGYMVWSALLYASLASLASWRVGRPLVSLDATRYARESDFRFGLMRVNQHAEPVAVYRGESRERLRVDAAFDDLIGVLRNLVSASTRLAWVTAGYGWFTIVAPIIVASPAYFSGKLTFGGLLMAVGAFTQVQQSLRWFIDNAGAIADWRATLFRVGAFSAALAEIEWTPEASGRIALVQGDEDKIIFDDLQLFSPSGATRLNENHIEIGAGAHVLVIGEQGSGKTLFFRALAGLWRVGAGVVTLPEPEKIAFIPKLPYVSGATLRDILAYPAAASRFTDSAYDKALTSLDLHHLAPLLDKSVEWEKELTDSEQQGLVFARLLVNKPSFIIVDEAIASLSEQTRAAFYKCFSTELAGATLIYISGPESAAPFFTRTLRLSLSRAGDAPA